MAISPLMIWDAYGVPQAFRLLAGTTLDSTQLGAATGFVAATIGATNGRLPSGRMVEFKSDLYLVHRSTVYKFNFGTKTWVSTGFTATLPPLTFDAAVGSLHVMDIAGAATMIFLENDNGSTVCRAITSTDGSAWTENAFFNSSSHARFTLPYEGKLWATGGGANNEEVWSWDPVGLVYTPYSLAGVAGLNAQLINFQGRLFWVGSDVSGSARQLIQMKEFVSAGFVDVPISGGSDPGVMYTTFTAPAGACGAFEQNGKLYVVFWEMTAPFPDLTSGQMRVFEFVPNTSTSGGSFQENDLTATVVPAAWRTGGAFDTFGSLTTQVQIHVDNSVPGTPQIFWWRYDSFTSAASTFWTWNGNASLCTTAAGVGRNYLTAVNPNVTGERIYTEGDFDVTLDNTTTRPDKIDFDCQVWLPLDGSSPASKQGRLYYSLGGDDWQVATISTDVADAPTLVSGAGPAPTVSGNLFQGVPVNDSKFQATWDAAADGFTTAGLRFELAIEIF